MGTDKFTDCIGEELVGFYDWLRVSSGEVIGVRETFSEEFADVAALIPEAPYVRRSVDPLRMEFFFANDRDFDDSMSSDQDFLMNRLMRSPEGDFAITFGIDDEVQDAILDAKFSIDWVEIGEFC